MNNLSLPSTKIVKAMTLNEMEVALAQEKKSKRTNTIFILTGIIVFLLMGGLVYNIHAKGQITKEVTKLQAINGKLTEENNKLKEQLAAPPVVKEEKPAASIIYHHIQSGDNFAVLSKKYYGTEVFAVSIAKINGLPKTAQLQVGQILQIPKEPDPSWQK